MRSILLCATLSSIFSGLAAGDGPVGVPPRPRPSDYPVRQNAKTAVIAAAIVPPEQAGKMFSPEIAKQYIVVEVAVYPNGGQTIDVKPLLFTLRVGDRIGGAEQPGDVSAGPANHGPAGRPLTGVTAETGIIYARTSGPAKGQSSQNVEAYSAVTVASGDARPPAPSAPSNPGPDPRIVADRLWDKALPEGQTGKAVAGYLYFPQYTKKRKSDALELSYSDNDVSAMLLFPK